MLSIQHPPIPVNLFDPRARTDGALALALPGLPSRPSGSTRSTGADVGLDGHLAAFYDRLPWTVTVAPRKAFHLREHVQRERAVRFAEISPDPEGWVTSIRVDADRADAGTSWLDAGLPQPTFVVRSRDTGRAHLIWTLGRWVRRDNPRAMRLLERVQRAYRDAVDGDRSYVGSMHHNPLSQTYSTIVGPQNDYDLGTLALYVSEAIFDPTPRVWSTAKIRADVADLGRNCSTFEHVRVTAYRDVARFREHGNTDVWETHVRDLVEKQNAKNMVPLPAADLRSLTRSIASWTWNVYRRGKKAASERKQRYEHTRDAFLAIVNDRRARAQQMHAAGMAKTAIAAALGVARSSVYNYLAGGATSATTTVQRAHTIRICAQGAEVGTAVPGDQNHGLEPEKTLRSAVTRTRPSESGVVLAFRPRTASTTEPKAESPSPPPNGVVANDHVDLVADVSEAQPPSGASLTHPLPGSRGDVGTERSGHDVEHDPTARRAEHESILARVLRIVVGWSRRIISEIMDP